MGIPSEAFDKYIREHSSQEDPLLYQLYRKTYLKLYHPRRSSDHLTGQFLTFISQLSKPKTILEIGTFAGYGSICLAKGLAPGGLLHTIELNDELEDFIKESFSTAGLNKSIVLHIGDALEIIPSLNEKFDLVFIDGDKAQYSEYFDLVIDKLNQGGFIIADNVLWNGKVLKKNIPNNDHFTHGIRNFNDKIQADERVENLLLPLYDGLMIIRRI
ncbi:MAG: O-methyltransferase [Bacteroidales bacterium]|nr:O-methyltransferase [Bacteroidales bacterium]